MGAGLHRADDVAHRHRHALGAGGAQDVDLPEIALLVLPGNPVEVDDVAVEPRGRIRFVASVREGLEPVGVEDAAVDVVRGRPEAPVAVGRHPAGGIVPGGQCADNVGVDRAGHVGPAAAHELENPRVVGNPQVEVAAFAEVHVPVLIEVDVRDRRAAGPAEFVDRHVDLEDHGGEVEVAVRLQADRPDLLGRGLVVVPEVVVEAVVMDRHAPDAAAELAGSGEPVVRRGEGVLEGVDGGAAEIRDPVDEPVLEVADVEPAVLVVVAVEGEIAEGRVANGGKLDAARDFAGGAIEPVDAARALPGRPDRGEQAGLHVGARG